MKTPRDIEKENLAVVDQHFRLEGADRIEELLPLYTDDIVWESPARGITLHGKKAAAENYHKMFGAMDGLKVTPVRRIATPDSVVDESIVTFDLARDGVPGAPLPVGTRVESRMVHIFEMRDRKIAREQVYEIWRDAAAGPGDRAAASSPTAEPAAGPNSERIMQLGLSFWGSKTLLSAVDLGVFTALAESPMDGEILANRLGLHRRSYRDFFDALVALGMLERREGLYFNTRDTGYLLDRAKPSYIGGLLEMASSRLYPFWGSLTQALQTGEPQNETKNGDHSFQALYSDHQRLRVFLQAMTGLSLGAAKAIADKFPWHKYRSFIDIGCAQGAAPVEIALKHPHLTGTGYDLPVVGPIFEEYVGRFSLSGRLRFQAGDFFVEQLPHADVLLMGHILHDWDLDQKKALLAKAYAALPEGGAFIAYDGIIDDDRRENVTGLLMSLNMLIETPGGFDYTGADCRGWMREVGFHETWVQHLAGPDSMVVGIK